MGDFSRDTFDKLKHYVGVRLQQGVPIVDADWNEQEDIRKYELQAFLKWFVGNGVPASNDGFRILAVPGANDDFVIKGGDGTPEGAGRCLVEGWDVVNESDLQYTDQALFKDATLATKWEVDPLAPLTVDPNQRRTDSVYLDIWEREVDAAEDTNLVNTAIGVETCVRVKREWVVRVAVGTTTLPPPPPDHVFYALASLLHIEGEGTTITDLRQTGLSLLALEAEIADARGIKANLGNRLDESLTRNGRLRHNVVGLNQLQFESVKSDATSLNANQEKLLLIGHVEQSVLFGSGPNPKPKIYLPVLAPLPVPDPSSPAFTFPVVTGEMIYQYASRTTGDIVVFLRLRNHSNVTVDTCYWYVYIFDPNT